MSPTAMAVLVAAAGMFIVGQALIMVLVDRHLSQRAQGEEQRLRDHIAELERTQRALEKTSNDLRWRWTRRRRPAKPSPNSWPR